VNELSSKLKENKEERQQQLESFEDSLDKKITELREEHEQAKVTSLSPAFYSDFVLLTRVYFL